MVLYLADNHTTVVFAEEIDPLLVVDSMLQESRAVFQVNTWLLVYVLAEQKLETWIRPKEF